MPPLHTWPRLVGHRTKIGTPLIETLNDTTTTTFPLWLTEGTKVIRKVEHRTAPIDVQLATVGFVTSDTLTVIMSNGDEDTFSRDAISTAVDGMQYLDRRAGTAVNASHTYIYPAQGKAGDTYAFRYARALNRVNVASEYFREHPSPRAASALNEATREYLSRAHYVGLA